MKTIVNISSKFFVLTIIAVFLLCTQSGGPVAGGAGAGNPVTLAVIAKGANRTIDNQIVFSPPPNMDNIHGIGDTLHIRDCCGMNVNVTDVYIAARDVYFPIPQNVDINKVPKDMLGDSNTFKINGPYIFNILKGTSEPELGTIILPDGN